MIKYFAIGLAAVALATVVYSASITGTAKAIGGGSTSVPHCQVSKSVANFVSGAIDTLDATVTCDETATYTVKANYVLRGVKLYKPDGGRFDGGYRHYRQHRCSSQRRSHHSG